MTSVHIKVDDEDVNEMAHICDDMRGKTDEEIHVVIMAYLNSSPRLYRRAMQQQHAQEELPKPTFRVIAGGKQAWRAHEAARDEVGTEPVRPEDVSY